MNENNSATAAFFERMLFEQGHISKLKYALLYNNTIQCYNTTKITKT